MATASARAPQQLMTLRRLLDRWVAEYPTISPVDPVRAEDLRHAIARFEQLERMSTVADEHHGNTTH